MKGGVGYAKLPINPQCALESWLGMKLRNGQKKTLVGVLLRGDMVHMGC